MSSPSFLYRLAFFFSSSIAACSFFARAPRRTTSRFAAERAAEVEVRVAETVTLEVWVESTTKERAESLVEEKRKRRGREEREEGERKKRERENEN